MNRLSILKLFILISIIQLSNYSGFAKKNDWFVKAVNTSKAQLQLAAKQYKPGQNPRSIKPDGTIRFAPARDWTCGFFPGSLWYMSELSGDAIFKKEAIKFTEALDTVQYFTHTHDLGFMLNCSYGNALRLTKNSNYSKVLVTGAESLITRFNPTVGCIQSWNNKHWQFPVIIDNMMNLEILFWASKFTKNNKYRDIAIKHANTTLKNHFREDYSTYHVVSYDTITGKAIQHQTHQGDTDDSAWARGQAWGLYGYTLMYRETKEVKYLEQAKHIASFIMNHPSLPEDKIPLWDFDTPNPKYAPRDASAAALFACAFLELSTYVKDGDKYYNMAEEILINLTSDRYLAKKGENEYFILKHSTGHLPNYSEIDTPINYADYYFLEALIRYKNLSK